jgi:hypothetical protein
MDWISQLECKHSISPALVEFIPELLGRKPVMIETIVVFDGLQHFQITTNQPVTS